MTTRYRLNPSDVDREPDGSYILNLPKGFRFSNEVVHVRGYSWDKMSTTAKGGATLVYHRDKSRDRIIRISVALVNDKDSYCKLTGRLIAAMQYDTGNHIAVRVPKNKHPVVFLKQMFSEMVAPYVS